MSDLAAYVFYAMSICLKPMQPGLRHFFLYLLSASGRTGLRRYFTGSSTLIMARSFFGPFFISDYQKCA